jgi:hypothetical protein
MKSIALQLTGHRKRQPQEQAHHSKHNTANTTQQKAATQTHAWT